MKKATWLWVMLVGLFLVSSPSAPARAAATPDPESEVRPLFEGKMVTILVGYPPGGTHDLEARVFGRHLPNYLPGHPRVRVQNMPGAGGIIMFRYLYSRAKPDGLTAGIFPSAAFFRQLLLEDAKFDMAKMPVVWAVSASRVSIVRDFLNAKTGKDLLRIDPARIVLGARTAEDGASIVGRLEMELLGIKGYKHVLGYAGDAPIRAAMERGEVSYFVATDAHILGSGTFAEIHEKGQAVPVWQSGTITPEGKVARSPVLPNVPTLYEVLQEIHGKPPSGVAWEAYDAASIKSSMLGRIWFTPPGTPQERVDSLRQAIARMADAPAFVADWERVYGQELAPRRVSPELADRLTKEFLKPAPWQEFLRKLFVKE